MSVRKEVFHPQIPLRIPCYDFTPITGLTVGPHLRLAKSRLHWVNQKGLPFKAPAERRRGTSGTTDFRGVTGGVYKARERIHRNVADLRLLAIPAS